MVVFTGKTVKDAILRASNNFDEPEDRLKVVVITQPRRGFLGIGRRSAKIEATVKPASLDQPVNSPAGDQPKPAKEETVHHNRAAVQVPKKDNWDDETDPAVIAARHESNVRHVRNAGQQLTTYLKKVFGTMGIKTTPEITAVAAHAITIDIKTPTPGRVIGHHGRRINAMEQISAAFMNYYGAPKTSVVLDTSNYRQRRREALSEIAQRSVTEVVASGQAVFLDPMPSRERKQLHKALENNDHVRTYSHGREPYRSVVIAPKD